MIAVPCILVVEDNPTTRKMLRLALVTEGYAVIEAADARAALVAAEKTLPDLVLQDLILPDMDGLELLHRLRALSGGTELPIVALSGFLSRLEDAQTDQEGFTALLVKPIEPSRLIEAIRVYLPQAPALTTSRGEGRRLLVVDDDPVQLKLTRIHFSQLGFEVFAASGASDALIAARAHRPDVILSDVFMPGTDGFDLCLEIRRDPNLANVPVVLLSGQYGSKADEDLARRVGASALVLRTPDFGNVAPAIQEALQTRAPTPAEQPSDQLALRHARLVIHQLERQAAATAGLAQHCGILTGQLSLLSGVADALTRKSDPDLALRDVLAATLDAAGISKGALILRDATGALELRQDIGFSKAERSKLQNFFGHSALLEEIVGHGGSVAVPSQAIPDGASRDILAGANVAAAQIVPLISDGRGVGAMIIGATSTDVTSDDSVAFARAMGNQVVQSLALAKSVASLSQERDRAQRYLDTAEVILLALDLEGRITLLNRKGCIVLGWAEGELIGRDFIETCVPARIRDETRKKLSSVHAGDDSIVENPIVTRTGDERLIEWRTSFQRDDEGRIVSTLSSGTDITERQQAHSALRQERDRAQRYLDTAEVLLLATDVNGRVTLINRKGCDLLGWTEGELRGRDFIEMCLPARIRIALRKKHQSVIRGDVSVVENPILTKSGEERLIEWHNVAQLDDGGHVIGTFSSGTDITERNQAAEALRTAEERIRFALQSADVGIWDMDYTTGALRWSDIIEAHYGLQPGTFGGTFEAFVERMHPDDRASVLETVEKAMKTGADFSVQHRSIWPDGTIRWLSGTGRVLLGEQGEPVRAVGISLDVTERRTLEEQFQQAQKMEAVGQLAGGVAHDFNNVLTAILGFTELMISGQTSDDPRRADLLEIKKAGERAAGLTRQLLAFSRKQILQPKVLDINVVIASTESMLKRLMFENVNLMLSLTADIGLVKIDPTQLEQILFNLVVNAADAMPRGGKLTIETANMRLDENYQQHLLPVRPGDYVMFAVSDTGVGMDEKTRRRIFEPFFTTKGVGKGTGLGLATVYGIVKQSGGDIWVYSEPGRGTTFKIYLPHVTAGVPSGIERLTEAASAPRGSETILLVEDDDGVRLLARMTLERAGYRVLQAANPREAMQVASEFAGAIQLLLSDVVMPESEGPPLFDRLSKVQQGLRVLYMSGYADEAIVRQGVLVEGTPFLQKPFTPLALAQKVRDVLEAPPMPSGV